MTSNLFVTIYKAVESFLGYISESEDVLAAPHGPIVEQPKLVFPKEKINWESISNINSIEIPEIEKVIDIEDVVKKN